MARKLPRSPRIRTRWNEVTVTNNIIANNVAGWDGGGVSMQDALKVRFINNTVVSNDTTASAGVLFNTLGAGHSQRSAAGMRPGSTELRPSSPVMTSTNQAAGLVTMQNTPNLTALDDGPNPLASCPGGYGYAWPTIAEWSRARCLLTTCSGRTARSTSRWEIWVTSQQDQQAVVTLVPSLNQTQRPATCCCDLLGTR